ncbi:MAG: ribosome assembly cofactor RimP [Sphaerochaetaceae bacterium]|nr:ribosome assembly cofactor RimP [Sphaerochaetaceae bacterium]MDC7236545.1 ribosome assembly cofactor RimP [Sphaerochaetaceae bacterium]MDC7244263.1 ribosome assembly cofactor RimP [Sphaerochaetaceae bacterium]MDC7250763.1 ribosome assembly cofactor RimP [Sphaerochaetaceae bacterium]
MKNNITKDPLFEEYAPLLEAMNVTLVDIDFKESPFNARLAVVIKLKDGEVGVNECAKVHNLIKTRMEVQLAEEQDFDLEVSTPGLQRKIRDAYEFTLFKEKRVRVYDIIQACWFSGIIKDVKEYSVILTNCLDQENNKLDTDLEIDFENISKAKLEYIWEDRKHAK